MGLNEVLSGLLRNVKVFNIMVIFVVIFFWETQLEGKFTDFCKMEMGQVMQKATKTQWSEIEL